jgi:hypothetical protein
VINTIMARDWRVVHISGHGEPPAKVGPSRSRVTIRRQQNGDPRWSRSIRLQFPGPREIENMPWCRSGCSSIAVIWPRDNTGQLLQKYDRARFAATVAETS